MLKKIIIWSFFLMFSCTTNESLDKHHETINSTKNTSFQKDSLIETLVDDKKEKENLDLTLLPPNESLKNDYSLVYDISEDTIRDNRYIQSLNLMKGNKHIKELSSTSYPMDSRYLGSVLDDFDSFFILESSTRGSFPPIWIDKIDKSSGKKDRIGLLADYDENEKVLIYVEESTEKDVAYIYDFKREKKQLIVEPASIEELKDNCSPIGLRTCLTIDTATNEYVIITTNQYDSTVTRKKIYR